MSTPGNAGKPATIYDVAELVGRAFPLAFTPNMTSGFRVTGLHPLYEDRFLPLILWKKVMWKSPHPVLTGGPGRQLRKLAFGIDCLITMLVKPTHRNETVDLIILY
ncbi:hypothetical protein AVEN_134112-1 [Araneus ventricosus]|uniref:Uncharacterized protein n=1 Tax=Araneus ventricosus TaxID=182803 RepID=A0A4Y2V1T3_ARAVE|nr:hypothetical protein AVEN_134112-1 [Araneus ventricosus]